MYLIDIKKSMTFATYMQHTLYIHHTYMIGGCFREVCSK